jgi:hypothetical protein
MKRLCGGDVPTILRIGPYRFHFYSDEYLEPPHIHIETPDGECKFWLDTVRLARNKGVPAQTIRTLEKLVFEHLSLLREKFDEFHKR